MATPAALVTAADPHSILLAARSWSDVALALDGATQHLKGQVFELLVQAFLQLDSRYDFTHVWSTHGEVPKLVLKKLNLFNRDVTGIDLVTRTRAGKFWLVQCKYHHDEQSSVSRTEATGLIAGRNRARQEFELALLCSTANGRSPNLSGEPDLEFLMGDVWRGLAPEFFERLHTHLAGGVPPPPSLKKPYKHQEKALKGIVDYFADQSRGKVIMPCATGKSLIGFWSAQRLGARRVLVAVPNLSLVRQLLKDWTEQSRAHGQRPSWIVVCSDDSVADEVVTAKDLGVKIDTDATRVAEWLRMKRRAELSVVFTTYQSGSVLAEAARRAGVRFDFGIFDEAHRTAGREGAPFAYLLSDDHVRVRKRVFMTATPRIYKGKDRDDIISMDNAALYGGEAFRMTFLEAMEESVIPNLTVVAVAVAEREVEKLLRDKRFLRLQAEHEDEVIRAEDLVSALAVRKAMRKYGIRRTLGFYSAKRRCVLAAKVQHIVGMLFPEYGPLDAFHVDGEMTAAQRELELREFEGSEHALMTNVRVFVEGVDCPSMDAVIFADPRQSTIDIVQGVGRALRPFAGKHVGYAIIPAVIDDDGTPSDVAYEQIVRIACALGSEDELILDYFAAIALGKPWAGRKVFEVLGDIDVGVQVDVEKINHAIAVRTYARTVEYRSFADARVFARKLGLDSSSQWMKWASSGHRPPYIPHGPYAVYAREWKSWPDWLGYSPKFLHGQKRPFPKARAFVHKFRFASAKAWRKWSSGGKRPLDIPAAPYREYQEEWRGWSDWLGSKSISQRGAMLPFRQAHAFARALGLQSNLEWREWSLSGKRPRNIPGAPDRVYRGQGWKNWGDWLGTKNTTTADRAYWPFKKARRWARASGARSKSEWSTLCRSGKKPSHIPGDPRRQYKSTGWKGWGDWFGTGELSSRDKVFWPFDRARRFARRLGIRGTAGWRVYCKSGERPPYIPAAPSWNYRNQGWVDWRDWLSSSRASAGRSGKRIAMGKKGSRQRRLPSSYFGNMTIGG